MHDREDVLEKRWREKQERCEPEPEPYREPDAVRARRQAAEHEDAWNAWFDNRLDQRLEEERADLIEVVGLALGEALDDQREDARQQLHDEVRALRIELAEVSTVVSELRQVIASEHARVLDLPPLPRVRDLN